MTSDYEVEIRAWSMEDEGQRKVFCRNFGRYWGKKYKKLFRILEECIDLLKKSTKGWPSWDRGYFSRLASKYDTTPIRRAKFLLVLKKAAIQYVESEKNNVADGNDNVIKNKDTDMKRINSMDTFLSRINSTII